MTDGEGARRVMEMKEHLKGMNGEPVMVAAEDLRGGRTVPQDSSKYFRSAEEIRCGF